jgi:hypothetical protein
VNSPKLPSTIIWGPSRGPPLILSLCDYTGEWSQPYADNGYEVIRIDLEHGQDVRLTQPPTRPVHGILAAPPCTVFANAGARWTRSDDEMREGLSVVDACLRLVVATRPKWWALENPVGKLRRYLGPPKLIFQPNEFGDPYTKRTCLWGEFTVPTRTPVVAYERSKMQALPPSPDRAALRSVTPAGFARAFFAANR